MVQSMKALNKQIQVNIPNQGSSQQQQRCIIPPGEVPGSQACVGTRGQLRAVPSTGESASLHPRMKFV